MSLSCVSFPQHIPAALWFRSKRFSQASTFPSLHTLEPASLPSPAPLSVLVVLGSTPGVSALMSPVPFLHCPPLMVGLSGCPLCYLILHLNNQPSREFFDIRSLRETKAKGGAGPGLPGGWVSGVTPRHPICMRTRWASWAITW